MVAGRCSHWRPLPAWQPARWGRLAPVRRCVPRPRAREPPGSRAPPNARGVSAAPSARQRYVTLFFSRSEITAGRRLPPDDPGIARLDTTVAPYLQSMGMSATGSLVTAKTT